MRSEKPGAISEAKVQELPFAQRVEKAVKELDDLPVMRIGRRGWPYKNHWKSRIIDGEKAVVSCEVTRIERLEAEILFKHDLVIEKAHEGDNAPSGHDQGLVMTLCDLKVFAERVREKYRVEQEKKMPSRNPWQ